MTEHRQPTTFTINTDLLINIEKIAMISRRTVPEQIEIMLSEYVHLINTNPLVKDYHYLKAMNND